ncbi:hypothetical protein G6011_06342 [Alternaria panax]|uniref:Xylanolytic transcriptional activator regulatory domain-containing protein n=1 Tax=Alternaria panax TaxID=48097 RepID=A0AAD4FF93_9PLEO|nr:hypothetical protein G6011_06342 [Alternaria panax]
MPKYPPLRAARNRTVDSGAADSANTFSSSGLQPGNASRANNGELMIADFNDAIPESSMSAWTWNSSVNAMVGPDAFGLPGLSLSDVNWLSPQYSGPIDLDALLANLGENADSNVEPWSYSVATTTPSVPEITAIQSSSLPERIDCSTENTPREVASERPTSISENRYYVDGTGARAPFGGRGQHSICSEQTIDLEEDEANIAITQSQTSNAFALCPLAAYQSLIEGIATESRNCLMEINPSSLPTHEQVALFVRQYFDDFHPVFPFLRRSSFAHDACKSWLLLLAVSIVGSRYSRLSHHAQLSEQLFHLLGLILTRSKYGLESNVPIGDEDVDYNPSCPARFDVPPSIPVLQAGILNVACMLHSGKKALVERALVERHFLVEVCHSLSLLMQAKRSDDPRTIADSENYSASAWLLKESRIRTGMMIWTLDTMFVYEFEAKPLMWIEDIDASLPCHEDIWEQPNLIKRSQRRVPDVALIEALEMMYVEKRLPTDLGEFSMGLLVSTIYRHTRDVLAKDRIRMNSWTPTSTPQRRSDLQPPMLQGWLPTTRLATKWRNSACDCLDVLHWPANSKVARHSGFEHHTVLQLHLARLIILAPTSAIQRFASVSSSKETAQSHRDNQSFAAARIQVLQWVIQDHCKARLCLVHCGALFWHVRRYSCSSLLEPFAVYIATLILWAFCICMQLPEAAEAIACESDEEPEPSFLHLDRPLDDELVQTYVRMGHKMSAYIANVGSLEHEAAPMRIAREGMSLLAKDSEHTSSSDDVSLSSARDVYHTWGIERSYINLLHLLTKE